MTPLPLLLGAGALFLLIAASSGKKAQAQPIARLPEPEKKKILAVAPSLGRRGGGNTVVVPFTKRKVPWRVNKKTRKQEMRNEVIEMPSDLARAASVKLGRVIPVMTFVLATMMASEVGRSNLGKVAVAHAALTMANRKRTTLIELLTPTRQGGRFGSQHGRYASTSNPPTEKDIELAQAILDRKIANPVPGADQWDSPQAQRKLVAAKHAGYGPGNTPEAVAQSRQASGKVAVYLPGVDPNYLRLWKPAAA